jgi:carboxymethylenebutenolidase
MGDILTLRRSDGGSFEAYQAGNDSARPSIIVLQEWWGLNDNIRRTVDRFAAEGFNAIAPDLYHGRVAGDADEASHLMDSLDFKGAVHHDIAATVDNLQQLNAEIAIMGYCMGGALTIAAAARLPDSFKAAVSFYGVPLKDFADPADITCPFQAHFAIQDDKITPEVAARVERDMKAAGRQPEIWHYEADHAFCNSARSEVYKPDLAAKAWDRMVAFLRVSLSNI